MRAEQEIPSVSIVIPVYNEGQNIEATLRAVTQHIPVQHEIIIAYDFDEDSTLPVLRRLAPEFASLRMVKNAIARGPSGAIRTAFSAARGEKVLVMMADLCDDFEQIPLLLSLVPSQADIACPSRYCPGGAQRLKPGPKVWIPRAAGLLLRLLTGVPTYDPTNSFKLYSAEVLRSMRLTSTLSFSVTLEVVAKAHCLGFRIVEVPTTWLDRQHGVSNFRLAASLLPYLRWFTVALLRNRLFTVPMPVIRRVVRA